MTKLQGKKQVNRLALLFAVTYLVSYLTRINYGAVLAEMETATQISKSLLSMAPTGSFITYGAGQIVSGVCGDRFSPKKLVSCGLTVTVLMNLLIPVCGNPYQMLAVWCVNGFAQAFMWPPLVRLMTGLLSEEDYKIVTVRVSWGSSFGTIAVYLLSPLLISVLSWKAVFLFSALCGGAMLFIWNKYACELPPEPNRKPSAGQLPRERTGVVRMLLTPLMISTLFAIICMGMLRDGVTTWMPSYISETYHMSSSLSILTGVLLPVFSILSFQLASWLYRKKLTNPMLCAGVLFGAGTLSACALFLLSGRYAAFSVLFSALLTGSMHGVNLILICMLPAFFQRGGNVSTVSGVLNAFTYVGSALSTYGIALLSERFGWNHTLLAWLLIGASGTALCLLCVRPWGRAHHVA